MPNDTAANSQSGIPNADQWVLAWFDSQSLGFQVAHINDPDCVYDTETDCLFPSEVAAYDHALSTILKVKEEAHRAAIWTRKMRRKALKKAQAIEAQRAETLGSVHESAVDEVDAPKDHKETPNG